MNNLVLLLIFEVNLGWWEVNCCNLKLHLWKIISKLYNFKNIRGSNFGKDKNIEAGFDKILRTFEAVLGDKLRTSRLDFLECSYKKNGV